MVSVRTAAQMTRTSKTTIQRHIKSGKLSATRNDSGEWEIDPAELARVMTVHTTPEQIEPVVQDGARPTPSNHTEPQHTNGAERPAPAHHEREIELLQQQIEMLQTERRREREQLQTRIDELNEACDDWKKQCNNQTLLLGNEQEQNQKSFWSRVFG